MNIVIFGLHYPITAALEQITRAFRKLYPDWRVVTVGPHMSNYMPYKGGIFVNEKYDFKPDIVTPNDDYGVSVRFIEHQLKAIGVERIDLWLDVNAGAFTNGKPTTGIKALFCTDPHTHLNEIYKKTAYQYDFIFNPQKPYWLGLPQEYYLPYAADEGWYRQNGDVKIYDVSLVGNIYSERVEYFRRLSSMNYRVYHALGIAKEDAGRIYANSKIGLNWSSLMDLTTRVFEIGMTGTVPLYNRVPDLDLHFKENEDYIGFSSIEEAIEKTVEILNNYEKYEHIGHNIRNKILMSHKWTDRVNMMLEIMKIKESVYATL